MKNTKLSEIYKVALSLFDNNQSNDSTMKFENYSVRVYSNKLHIKNDHNNGVFIITTDPSVESNIQPIINGSRIDRSTLPRFNLNDTIGDFFNAWRNIPRGLGYNFNERIVAEIELLVYTFIEDHISNIADYLVYKHSEEIDHPGYGAGSGVIITKEYYCPCGINTFVHVFDNIPGFKEHHYYFKCDSCCENYILNSTTGFIKKKKI